MAFFAASIFGPRFDINFSYFSWGNRCSGCCFLNCIALRADFKSSTCENRSIFFAASGSFLINLISPANSKIGVPSENGQ